jgi:hypothetical protein
MTRPEMVERMAYIVKKGVPDGVNVTQDSLNKALDILSDYVNGPGASTGRPNDLNVRTLIKIAIIVQAESDTDTNDYIDLCNYMLSVS